MEDPLLAKLFASLDKPAARAVHPAGLGDAALLAACELLHGRGRGPGGQHRNNNQTAVTLTHRVSGVSAQAAERRSVEENKKVALRRLRLALAVEVRVGVPAGEIRSELWRARTAGGRISLSTRHRDFPTMLAEALDVLEASGFEPKRAAVRLGVSPTQLVRLVAEHPPALAMVNRVRKARGEHELRG